MKKSILTLAVVSALSVTTFTNEAKADTPSFDFLQLSKTTLDFDDGSEPDGFEFKWQGENDEVDGTLASFKWQSLSLSASDNET